jgi:hypothetical protein
MTHVALQSITHDTHIRHKKRKEYLQRRVVDNFSSLQVSPARVEDKPLGDQRAVSFFVAEAGE